MSAMDKESSGNLPNTVSGNRKLLWISRGFSLAVGSIGLCIIGVIISALINTLDGSSFGNHIFLLLVFIPLLVWAGFYYLKTATILWQQISYKSIRRLTICLTLIFFPLLLSPLSMLTRLMQLEETILHSIDVVISFLFAGAFYVSTKKYLLKWFSLQEEFDYDTHRAAVKLYWGLLSFFLWGALGQSIMFLPQEAGNDFLPANPLLGSLIVFGSIPIAYGVYRAGIRWFLKADTESRPQTDPASSQS